MAQTFFVTIYGYLQFDAELRIDSANSSSCQKFNDTFNKDDESFIPIKWRILGSALNCKFTRLSLPAEAIIAKPST